MADVSYTPTFHHTDWQDRIDRVEAGRPNGFNTRFRAVEDDLRRLSTVVSDISSSINRIRVPPIPDPTLERRLTFAPTLFLVDDGRDPGEWFVTDDGAATSSTGLAHGIMHVALPDRVRLTGMRVRAHVHQTGIGFPTLRISLLRTAVQLTPAPAVMQPVSILETHNQGFLNLFAAISGPADVDLSTFRYMIDATFENDFDLQTVDLTSIEFTFLPR